MILQALGVLAKITSEDKVIENLQKEITAYTIVKSQVVNNIIPKESEEFKTALSKLQMSIMIASIKLLDPTNTGWDKALAKRHENTIDKQSIDEDNSKS